MVNLDPRNGLSTNDRLAIRQFSPRRLGRAGRGAAPANAENTTDTGAVNTAAAGAVNTAAEHTAAGRRRWIQRLAAPFALGASALLLSGCLSSGYAYYSHHDGDDTEVYFKLPTKWKIFTPTQVIEAVNGKLSPSQLADIESGEWAMSFAGSNAVKLKDVGSIGAKVPEGEAFARQLGSTERDSFSLQSLRELVLDADPLQAGSGPYNVLNYTEFTWPGGIRGSRMTVDITGSHGLVTTFGQVAAVDPQTNWVFGVFISCRASCWGPDTSLINQVFNSWTVKELAR